MSSKSIYQGPTCSCIICRKEFSAGSFHTHYQRIHEKSQSNYSDTSAANLASSKKWKEVRKQYEINPKQCLGCDSSVPYEGRRNKFCSQSCGAKYSNARKDYSVIRTGPKKGAISTRPKKIRPIKLCIICDASHTGKGKTCSPVCKKSLLKIRMRERIDAGWNPQENRCRSRPSYLEKSFLHYLETHNVIDFIHNKTFRCDKKIYYGDFYFPERNLLIELDGSQHEDAVEYDLQRDMMILEYHGVKTLRISHKEYISKAKKDLVDSLLEIESG